MDEGDGQLHTLTVLEQLREASKSLWVLARRPTFEWMNASAVSKSELARHSPQSPLSGRDVGPNRSTYPMSDCGVGERCGRTCCIGCSDCELSGSAVHVEEWDTSDKAASGEVVMKALAIIFALSGLQVCCGT